MRNFYIRKLSFVVAISFVLISNALGQPQATSTPDMIAKRNAIEAELQSLATVYRKVMVL